MAITGAILGDIAGSQYEFSKPDNPLSCKLFTNKCRATDDTIMSLAIKKAIDNNLDYVKTMQEVGRHYPNCGYGRNFYKWLFCDNARPYRSYGNGSAMRVSYVADFYDSLEEVKRVARATAEVSHDHSEGIKGAVVTAVCIWMAKHGKSKDAIYSYVLKQYPPNKYEFSIDKSVSYLEKYYKWDVSCMRSVPVAMRCFYESEDFESFMRNLFRLDCDMDTLGAIGGSVAEEYYHGFGFNTDEILKRYLDSRLLKILFGDKNYESKR